jgi:hypothetical protein
LQRGDIQTDPFCLFASISEGFPIYGKPSALVSERIALVDSNEGIRGSDHAKRQLIYGNVIDKMCFILMLPYSNPKSSGIDGLCSAA